MTVALVTVDSTWSDRYSREAACIVESLGALADAVHHIGSTAVPGILAKPILDLLLEVADREALDAIEPGMLQLGYEAMGEFGIAGRRYFRKHDAAGRRTHHVHAFVGGDPNVRRHLAFRDYLRAHTDVAAAYATIKRDLAADRPAAYVEGKGPFVVAHEALALEWLAVSGRHGRDGP